MAARLVESRRGEYRLHRGSLQVLDELPRHVRVARVRRDPGGVGGGGLDLLRQGTDQLDPLALELPDLGDGGEADLHALAARHVLEHLRRGAVSSGLRLELLADAEQLEELLQV